MDTAMLALVFVAAVGVAAAITMLFARPIDQVLERVVPAEMSGAWSLYAKFALFVATLGGGLRLTELGSLAGRAGAPPITVGQALLEIEKTVLGSLNAGAWILLAFFGTTLCLWAARLVYHNARGMEPRRPDRHMGVPAGRP